MRFWWLIPVVLAVVVIATVVGWMLARRAGVRSGKKGWVANTGYLRGLPKYQALVRRTRASLAMAFVCFLIAVIATSVSAGAPVDRYVKHDKSTTRRSAGPSGKSSPTSRVRGSRCSCGMPTR